jgi:hypothetical protein
MNGMVIYRISAIFNIEGKVSSPAAIDHSSIKAFLKTYKNSGFCAWQPRPENRRAQQNRALLARMQVLHQETRESYGARKM